MSNIKVLPPEQVIKIAAGEVVRRPASMLKELCENSIDAGAKNLIINISSGGKNLVQVSDDGCGMDAADAKLCVQLHATSKINRLDDLASCYSFGFRGEALASISRVCQFELTTNRDSTKPGIKLAFESEELVSSQAAAAPVGTSVAAKNLFWNLPARRKFLKSAQAEQAACEQTFIGLALAYHTVGFKLYADEKLNFNTPKVISKQERIAQLFDHRLAENLLEFSGASDHVKVSGFTSNLQQTFYNRSKILIFVNGRCVQDSKLASAVCAAYAGALPAGRFPAAFIFIQIPADQLDVNVHPCKTQVVFAAPGKVLGLVKVAINKALENLISDRLENISEINLTNASGLNQGDVMQKMHIGNLKTEKNLQFSGVRPAQILPRHKSFDQPFTAPSPQGRISESAAVPEPTFLQQEPAVQQVSALEKTGLKILGQLFSTYILVQKENSLLMVDQHAASERILYEQAKEKFENLPQVKLIFPEVVKLNALGVKQVLQQQELLKQFGLQFDQISDQSLAITTAPPGIEGRAASELIQKISELVVEHDSWGAGQVRKELFEHMHSHLACKMAIKAGDFLDLDSMQNLLSSLEKCKNRFQCIHGRPTMFEVGKAEVEKWFKRR